MSRQRKAEVMKGERLGEFEEVVLLGLRSQGADGSAVDIQETLHEVAARSASLGSLYNVLDRLERKKLVQSWIGDPPTGGGRPRRCYALTAAGTRTLEESQRVRERLWALR